MALKVKRTFKGETSRIGDQREEQWAYNVISDSLTFTVNQAKYADDGTTAIPSKGMLHDDDPDMICVDVSASRDQELPTLIRVTVQWRTPTTGQGEQAGPAEGTTPIWNVELAFDREAYAEQVNKDLDHRPITNTIGEYFDPVDLKRTDAVYIYTYYVKDADWLKLGESHGKVNSKPVTLKFNGRQKTFPAYTLQVETRYNVQQTYDETAVVEGAPVTTQRMVWKVEYRLTHKADTHFTKLVNKGYHYLGTAGNDSSRVRFTTNGQPNGEPGLLAADGTKLGDGENVVLAPIAGPSGSPPKWGTALPNPFEPGTPSYPGFRLIELLDFATLPGFGG